MRGASEVVLPKWSTEEPETSRLRHARCVAVVEQERVSVRVGEGLLYAEPGSKSEQAVAMLAATIGEPNAAQSHDHPDRRAQAPAEPA